MMIKQFTDDNSVSERFRLTFFIQKTVNDCTYIDPSDLKTRNGTQGTIGGHYSFKVSL